MNFMEVYTEYWGAIAIVGARDATHEPVTMGLIGYAEVWMDMIKSRNESSQTYNTATTDEIYGKVVNAYHPLFIEFVRCMLMLHAGNKKGLFDAKL